jgi:nitroimidazol reductase NimA-like FMN-containing flavoprotein (pyridoxamine 5'-phosphate oxidase superfamily)
VTQRKIDELSRDECLALLPEESVGRLAFVDADGPVAVPVNYALAGEQIVFRVEGRSHLREAVGPPMAFEVDHTEPDARSGWSVLVRGTAHEVALDDVPDLLRQMSEPPRPWAEGIHSVWVAITPHKVTGRRLSSPFVGEVFF